MYRYRRRRYKRGRKRRVLAFLLLVFAFVFAELRLPAMKAELRTAALTAHAQGCIAKTVPEYLPQTVCEKDGAETALSTYALGVLEAELTDALRKSLNGTAKAFVPLGNGYIAKEIEKSSFAKGMYEDNILLNIIESKTVGGINE